jgi:hypothetical protein
LFAALVVQAAVVLVTVPLYGLVGLSIPSSTVLLGLHYVIDVIAAVGVCAVVIVVERAVRPWLEPSVSSHPSGPRATR